MGFQSVEATDVGRDQKEYKDILLCIYKTKAKVWADLYLADFLSLRS